MKLQNHAYPRRFAVLGAVFAAALFGSVLLGRFSVTPKELFRLLLSRLTETEQGWPSARCGCGPHRRRAGGCGRVLSGHVP